jgi:predicted nucleic acid-binding protein
MVYLDTSVLVALHTREPMTEVVQDWFDAAGSNPCVTATWTVTEFASALGIKQRTRQITAREAKNAWQSFSDQHAVGLRLLDSERASFLDAAALIRADASGLRGGDALHLTVARRNGITSIASLDLVMTRMARKLGMGTVDFKQPRRQPT